ncbi:MAG TPA: hypothetical protein VGE45_20935 [Chloroflexia bacterium]|jgi:acetylornithine deacetylase/succinyl-diaminopimelate desuccinylase-like protein
MQVRELLEKLVSINSVFPGEEASEARPGEEKLAEFIDGRLKQWGFAVERQYVKDRRFNVLAEKGQGDRAYCCRAT